MPRFWPDVPLAATVGTGVLAVAAGAAEAIAAVDAGARLVELSSGPAAGNRPTAGLPACIEAIRRARPGTLICAASPAADVVTDPAAARQAGKLLLCADPGAAAASGLPRASVLIRASPGLAGDLVAAGWAVAADVDAYPRAPGAADDPLPEIDDPLPEILAVTAVCAWLGAAFVRTRHVAAVARAAAMTECIQGRRAPARAVRGLA